MALLVVLGFVIVLSVLAAAFTTNMQVEAILARNSDAESDVDWLCRSGVEYAKYVLSQQMADTSIGHLLAQYIFGVLNSRTTKPIHI